MKMGVYCSPWDRNNALYGKPEYVTAGLYRNQLRELYTNYGPLFISWHDGANGGDGYYGGAKEKRMIDRSVYYDWKNTWGITRKLQPGAVIFGDVGPDVRWVGNENGYADATSWATYTPHAPDTGKEPANGYTKDYEGTKGQRDGKYWMPAECDVSLRPGWFYHADQDDKVKSPAALLSLYYKSVGRGACLDLGLSPNKSGLLHANDVRSLQQFGDVLKKTFAVNLAQGATLDVSSLRGANREKFGPQFLLDNDRYTYWATDDNVTKAELVISLQQNKTFNIIRLRENIKLGQRIDSVAVDIFKDSQWKLAATATSIGGNRLIRLPHEVTTNKVRLRVIKASASIALSDFGLYKEAPIAATPLPKVAQTKTTLLYDTLQKPVLVSRQFAFTEGPAVDKLGNVFFTDQPNNKIWKYSTDGKLSVFMDKAGRANGMYFDKKGNLIACADEHNQLWSISQQGKVTVLITDLSGKHFNGPNDIWVAPNGNMYFTDPYYQRDYWTRKKPELDSQRVYFLPNNSKKPVVANTGVKQPNGVVGTADGKHLFVADIGDGKVYKYDIGAKGNLTNRVLFAKETVDGMTLDRQGNVYLAGRGVSIYSPDGKKLGRIPIPEEWTGNVCFGGKNMDMLFITASKGIYTVKMNVTGDK
jgi:alpha-L-fucosidase